MPLETGEFAKRFFDRVDEHRLGGKDYAEASGLADLDLRVMQWPSGWGDDFVALVYGDFRPPKKAIELTSLGITVLPTPLKETVIRNAICVLKAEVKVSDKSISSVTDAARRLDLFVGACSLVGWGNYAVRWWFFITQGTASSVYSEPDFVELSTAIDSAVALPEKVRRKIESALFWMSAPKSLRLETKGRDVLNEFSGFWNAFECLIDAHSLLRPRVRPRNKQRLIDDFFDGKRPTASTIEECYRTIINPGLRSKAERAMREFFPHDVNQYLYELFGHVDINQRLYDIRNSINHGDIDVADLEALNRVESRFGVLRQIVMAMTGRFLRFKAPIPQLNRK